MKDHVVFRNHSKPLPHRGFVLSAKYSMNQEPNNHRPGPKGGAWGEVVKRGIMVGRNAVVVPPDEVAHLASLGCTDIEIARYYGVQVDTFRRHFEEYLSQGRHQLRTTLRQAQLRVALEGNPTMLIWLGKNLLQQNEMGQGNDEKRALPWTDDMAEEVIDLDDNHTEVVDTDATQHQTTTDS